ncbi:MAG: NIPSNAP family protein, partial [Silvibacterium sp.]|nr:NIPSNAP family protein [Silvibacterium sp.]
MQRRRFLASSLAASAVAFAGKSEGQPTSSKSREYYELRKYLMQSGPQTKLTESYLSGALIPALNRLGMSPIGVFNLTIGPETPTLYVLIPSTSVESLVTSDLRLAQDQQFLAAAAPFWNAPAAAPPFIRVESTLLIAFEGWPKITLPPSTAQHGKRMFELRTYESATNQDHVRKVEMFHKGEFDIFQKAGFDQVFYGDALIGPRLPHLTYMLSFADLTERDAKWDAFRNNPDWKKLSSDPRYAFEPIVSNITNLILTPASCSQ